MREDEFFNGIGPVQRNIDGFLEQDYLIKIFRFVNVEAIKAFKPVKDELIN